VGTVRAHFERQNAEAAGVILADIEKYGGEGSGAVQWARLCLARLQSDAVSLSADQLGEGGSLRGGDQQLVCASTARGSISASPRRATATERSLDR
jgi:hypothetical protein